MDASLRGKVIPEGTLGERQGDLEGPGWVRASDSRGGASQDGGKDDGIRDAPPLASEALGGAASEGEWLESACELPLRAFEQRVAEASTRGEEQEQGPGRTGEPAGVHRASPEPTEVGLVLPAATWALVQRAMEGARRRSGSSLSDAQALEAVARDALTRQAESGATGHDQGRNPDEQGGALRGAPSVTPRGHDQGGAHHGEPLVTPRGHDQGGAHHGEPLVTPRGHDQGRDEAPLRSDPESDHGAGAGGVVGGRLLSLLSLTGGRDAWHPDRLCEESGFSPSAVLVALLELVLAHQVRLRADGCYERVLPRLLRLPRRPRRAPDQPRLACQALR